MTEGSRPPPEQLVLDLSHRPALGAEDFLVSASNRAAVDLIDRWPDWPHRAVLVVGPAGSGKSHLVNVWRGRSAAARLVAGELNDAALPAIGVQTALAIEDLDQVAGREAAARANAERVLFHLLNLVREQRLSVLLTTSRLPADIEIALPDLRSRLGALPFVSIDAPDAGLLAALLVKLFSDRQLSIEPNVIAYMLRHMERTTAMARWLVGEVDRRALVSKRRVTRSLVAEIMGGISSDDADTHTG
jgi:chromosomal replication initiation ATPase DnaA